MKMLITMFIAMFVAGCASSGDYAQYVAAQSAANQQAVDTQSPWC